MTEDPVQRAAKMLLNGATMLHITCPNCKDPIYRLRDMSHMCATCDKPVIFKEEEIEKVRSNEGKMEDQDPIEKKISKLAIELEAETDPTRILQLATLIKKLKSI